MDKKKPFYICLVPAEKKKLFIGGTYPNVGLTTNSHFKMKGNDKFEYY